MRYALLLVAVLVAVAGCSAVPGSSAPTTSPTTAPAAPTDSTSSTTAAPPVDGDDDLGSRPAVEGGTLSFDPNVTFDRLEALLGVDADQPTVMVRDEASFGDLTVRNSVFELFGVANGSAPGLAVSGSSGSPTQVAVGFSDAPAATVEGVLVHEMTHALQIQTGVIPYGEVSSFDERQVRRAIIEGGAVYASTEYAERHLPGGRTWTAYFGAEYRSDEGGTRYVASTSYFGARYYDATLDDPSGFESVAPNAPRTTEALLHPGTNDTTPVPLAVAVGDTDAWSAGESDRYGELFTRVVLGSELPESRAATAAAGWGNDSLVRFERGDDTAVAWVHRWDASVDADEFVAAFADYRDARSRDTGARFRVVRVNETTTAVFAGPPVFVGNATVSVDGGVRVSTNTQSQAATRQSTPR